MSLREQMPQTAGFIDFLREAFGPAQINAAIKKGMAGIPGHFHARENGLQAGTPFAESKGWVSLAQIDVAPVLMSSKSNR